MVLILFTVQFSRASKIRKKWNLRNFMLCCLCIFSCPFMQQQLQTAPCNAILLFHCLVLISRRVLVYFMLTVQHFSWNILDFSNRTANLISFLVIVPQGVLNGALTDFLSAIIEIGSHELWFWFVYSAVFQSIESLEKRMLWCSWEFSCLLFLYILEWKSFPFELNKTTQEEQGRTSV